MIRQISSTALKSRRFLFSRQLSNVVTEAATVAEKRKGTSKKFKFMMGLVSVAGVSSLLIKTNIENPKILPSPVRTYAIACEGVLRFAGTSYYILPSVVEWLKIEKWDATRVSKEELNKRRNEANKKTAERLLGLARSKGGIFVKSGQNICASPVVPPVYVDVLRVLMDNAIPQSFENTVKTWNEEFETPLEEAFESFNPEPIATASLAQVYEATLKNGQKVAVKFQHREVARLFNVDLSILLWYYETVAWIFPQFDFRFMAEEMKRAFTEELDFVMEAENGKKAKEIFSKVKLAIIVPRVIDQFSSSRVLTMEFEEGVRLDNIKVMKENGINVQNVARTLMSVFSEMMFIHGFVHCDPHPGNILVRKAKNKDGCELVLLDHGTYQNLTEEVRYNYANIWKSVTTGNFKKTEEFTEKLGVDKRFAKFVGFLLTFSPPTKDPLVDNVDVFDTVEFGDMEEAEELAKELLGVESAEEMNLLVGEHAKVMENLPRSLILLLKTNNLLRFANEQLGTPVNRFAIMANYASRGINMIELKRNPGIRTRIHGMYESFKVKAMIFLHPILTNLYVRFFMPKIHAHMKKKNLNLTLA